MQFQSTLIINWLVLSILGYQIDISADSAKIDINTFFDTYNLKYFGQISSQEIYDYPTNFTISSIEHKTKVYFKPNTFSGNSEIAFYLQYMNDSTTVSQYFETVTQPDNQAQFAHTKFIDKRFVYVIQLQDHLANVQIHLVNNKCLHFFAYISKDPDITGSHYREDGVIRFWMLDDFQMKSQVDIYTRQGTDHTVYLSNPFETQGQRVYLKILCPFLRKNQTTIPRLELSFSMRDNVSEPVSPTEPDTNSPIKCTRSV